MIENIEIEAHKFALNNRTKIVKSNSFFVFESSLYRLIELKSKDKIKNICWSYPEYLGFEKFASPSSEVAHYIFKIYCPCEKVPKIIKFLPRRLASKRCFSLDLMKTVPYSLFVGSKDDFNTYLAYCFDGGKPFIEHLPV